MADDSSSSRPNPRTADTGGEGGEVTLTGTVESRDARWVAEVLAESVPGMRAVHNRLRVAHG